MKIAIHAADLDHDRIDGTRVYLLNMLKQFGFIDKDDQFFLYHKNQFNPNLEPPKFKNYVFKTGMQTPFWTQLEFARLLKKDAPDVIWMPVHNVPLCTNNIPKVVTIHDLAFKHFPRLFPKGDLMKLNLLTRLAVARADKIIAISHSTKQDILKFFPKVPEDKIVVIHHGFEANLFEQPAEEVEVVKVLDEFGLARGKYILYVGAIQPRKNLVTLISAYDKIKNDFPEHKLVFAGAPAWHEHKTLDAIKRSPCSRDIVVTGTIPFAKMSVLYQNASVFVFPSLYEGFGIPILEAMASGVPVICAHNSSLPEVGGEAVTYFDAHDVDALAGAMTRIVGDNAYAQSMIGKGKQRIKQFSWEKCARETLEVIKSVSKK